MRRLSQLVVRNGARRDGNGRVGWRVWAPNAKKKVQLVFDDGQKVRYVDMQPLGRGYYQYEAPSQADLHRYAFRLDEEREYPDPCSLWQPDGVHGRSALYFPETFAWTDSTWRGIARSRLAIYELHVGTFTPAGTFEAVIERLAELRDLGITALEIMPVAQFPGDRNWGYDGVYLYAAQNSYGGPRGLQKLVDAAHGAGLAVILDVVYNHFGPEGNYLSAYGPYFTDHYKTPWGSAVNYDGPHSEPVREFVLSNVRMWLEEFHFDGLRLDAVHAIYDFGAQHILSEIQRVAEEVAQAQNRQIHIIAESDLNDPRLLHAREQGGYGLGAQWSDDFHHVVHAQLTGETQGYYADFGRPEQLAQVLNDPFVYGGDYSEHRQRRHGAPAAHLPGDRFVVAIQNHDQVGNRARGDRLSTLVDPPRLRLGASLLLLAPHLPMLFMGEEYGETHPFLFFCSFSDEALVEAVRNGRRNEFAAFAWQGEVPDPQSPDTFAASRLSWTWPEGSSAAGLRQLYQDLLHARPLWPALTNYVERRANLVERSDSPLLYLERGPQGGEPLRIVFNLSGKPLDLPDVGQANAELLFSSEHSRYHGSRDKANKVRELLPYECLVYGPAGWSSLF
jgi:maltooligosyltrehalose trehalohydrolase